jgi:hypothetical protein
MHISNLCYKIKREGENILFYLTWKPFFDARAGEALNSGPLFLVTRIKTLYKDISFKFIIYHYHYTKIIIEIAHNYIQ